MSDTPKKKTNVIFTWTEDIKLTITCQHGSDRGENARSSVQTLWKRVSFYLDFYTLSKYSPFNYVCMKKALSSAKQYNGIYGYNICTHQLQESSFSTLIISTFFLFQFLLAKIRHVYFDSFTLQTALPSQVRSKKYCHGSQKTSFAIILTFC